MPTGYGYVRDKEPLFVNWAEVSQKFTDQLKADEEARLATKKEILDNRNEFTKTLLNKPVGQNTALNRILSGYTDQVREYSLSNLQRYKDKDTTLAEYNAFENNLKSGTDLLFDAVEGFNSNFDNYAQRAQDGSASKIEVFMHELTQNYTDFGRVSLDVDPKTGEVIISELGEDGNPTGKTLDVSQLGYFSKFTRDKYDIDGAVNTVAENLGTKFLQDTEGRSLKYQGQLYDEIVSNEELMKGLDTEIKSLIDEGFELESVLADSMNYKIVTDKTDNPFDLYFNQDTNEFEITDAQKQAAFDHVKEKMLKALDIDRREPEAEDELSDSQIQSDLIRKIQTVALYGDKVPRTLIEQLLSEEELAEYDKLVESQGGTDAIQGLVDDITTVVGLSDLTEEQFADNDTVNQALGGLQALGIDASVSGGGNMFSARIITIKERGDKGQGISIDTKGKTQQQIIDEIVRLVPSVRSLEDLATSLAFIRRQSNPQGDTQNVPPFFEWSQREENKGKGMNEYIEEFNLSPAQ